MLIYTEGRPSQNQNNNRKAQKQELAATMSATKIWDGVEHSEEQRTVIPGEKQLRQALVPGPGSLEIPASSHGDKTLLMNNTLSVSLVVFSRT